MDLLIKSYSARNTKGGTRYGYPFRIYPPPVGFNRGVFDRDFMDEILDLRKRLRPKQKKGGRVQADTIELRAMIFAIRVNVYHTRKLRHILRLSDNEVKARWAIDDESFAQLKTRSQRVTRSLENHVKRANRALVKAVTQQGFKLLMDAWPHICVGCDYISSTSNRGRSRSAGAGCSTRKISTT